MSVTVVGSINVDLGLELSRFPSPGETLLAGGGRFEQGGKGSNQALAARLTGADVNFVGCVGNDEMADVSTKLLKEAGVNLEAVRTVPRPTGLAVISVDEAGENTVVVIPGANAELIPNIVHENKAVLDNSNIVLCQGEIPLESIKTAAEICANKSSGRFVLNLAPVVPVAREVILQANPLIVNEHEAAGALGFLTGQQVAAPTNPEAEREVLQAIITAGVGSAVMTLGPRGALVATESGITEIPAPRVKAVDTVGAGDGFVGSLCARLDAGDDLVEAARFAARFAAYSVTRKGAGPSYTSDLSALPSI